MVKEDEFNLFTWSMGVPLCDDLWLGMQIRNIALVDMAIIRKMETDMLNRYFELDRTPPELMVLSGISQMWVFSLYEFLRTWRQKAKHIIKVADEYETVQPRKREKFLKQVLDTAETKHKFVKNVPRFYVHQLEQIPKPNFVAGVKDYLAKTEALFDDVSRVRMMLAKHEVMGTGNFAAEAPGYGRMRLFTGAMYWQVSYKDGTVGVVDRRKLANAFLEIEGGENDYYDGDSEITVEVQPAELQREQAANPATGSKEA
jgi:hypothetical protein